MTSPKNTIVLATFRVADNVLTHIADTTFRINSKLTQNSDLEAISTQAINLITNYIDEYYPYNNINIRFDSIVSTENCADVPLINLILAEFDSSKDISENIKTELYSIVKKFIEDVLADRGDIFATKSSDRVDFFTSEKSNFIDGHTSTFINKFRGKSITKPFMCIISGETPIEIPLQGAFKSPVIQNTGTKGDATFFAHCDGVKGSEMLTFMKIVGTTSNLINHTAKTFIAEQESFLKIAATAYASDNLLVKIVICEKTDDKGKTRSYLKEIVPASMDDLEAFELKLIE
ncbi:MAG: hypothetical protein RBR82_14410 [Pseudomonas sp.]|nr:hypothetical protein [Pseudomonas sp.]